MSWVLYTIAATILQSFRNLEQKHLNKKLDAFTVSWSRFILPMPFALVVVYFTFFAVSKSFVIYCLITACFQVAGNVFLLKTFQSKNFSIGITFFKTEVLQTMIIGFLFFHQNISYMGVISIMIVTAGVITMSGLVFNSGITGFVQSLRNKAALYGLLSGLSFSISAFNLKFASSELIPLGYQGLKAGMVVLMWVISFQNILFLVTKSYQKRLIKDLNSLFSLENKVAFFKTTILSFSGSVCWFAAFSLGEVVYVKVVGQMELIIAIAISHFILKEKHKTNEAVGIFLTALGILMLILYH
jgi:drug/metabolite transporter (DMT)-like permease